VREGRAARAGADGTVTYTGPPVGRRHPA
jgi:hypothetical protein